MMKKWFHILIVISLLLAAGCQREPRLDNAVSGLVLTVRCEDPALTKVDPEPADGETRFNENLIKSVDFFFYPGETPRAHKSRCRTDLYGCEQYEGYGLCRGQL